MFAVQYSLQCLSVFSQSQSSVDTTATQGLEACLKELLVGNQVELLASQAAELRASQEFLKSVSSLSADRFIPPPSVPYHLPGVDSQPPLTPGPVLAKPAGGAGGDLQDAAGGESIGSEDITPQQEEHQLPSPPLPQMPPNFPFMMQPRPPPPFMMPPPPPHGNMPMYYMAPMPIPAHLGYMPFLPQVLPRHVAPPPLPPQPPTDVDELYRTPDNAHRDSPPVQGELQQESDLDSAPQQQQQQQQSLPLPHPSPGQLKSSEMVASVYPIPPLAMDASKSPAPMYPSVIDASKSPGPVYASAIDTSKSPSAAVDASKSPAHVYPISPTAVLQAHAPTSSAVQADSLEPEGVLEVVSGGGHTPAISTSLSPRPPPSVSAQLQNALPLPLLSNESPNSSATVADKAVASVETTSARNKRQTAIPATTTANTQSRTQRPPRKVQPSTSGNSSEPGLPCRPSATPQAQQHQQQQQQQHRAGGKHGGGGGGGGGRARPEAEGQKRNMVKSRPNRVAGGSTRRTEPDEHSPAASENQKRRPNNNNSSSNYRTGRSRRDQRDHTLSSATVASPKSNQDPSRTFGKLRSSSSSSSTGTAQNTKDFRWGIPSPSSSSTGLIDSTHVIGNPTPTAPNNEPQTEWPDFSELDGTSGGGNGAPQQASKVWEAVEPDDDGLEPCVDTDILPDPFPPPSEVWNVTGDYTLTLLSPT